MTEIYQNLRSQHREHFIDCLKADHVGVLAAGAHRLSQMPSALQHFV